MKIVQTDNFNRENMSESWILSFSVSEETAKEIARLLNDEFNLTGDSAFYAKVVPNDYQLYEFQP